MEEIPDVDLLSRNKDLAEMLGLIGSYYIMARDTYRAKTFNNVSTLIANYPELIVSGAQVQMIKGIGPSTVEVINQYLQTGKIKRLEELEEKFQERKTVIEYFRSFYGIGAVSAAKFYDLGYRTLEDLWSKANLTEAQKTGILWREHMNIRIPKEEMKVIHETIKQILEPKNIKFDIAGSYRRQEPSSGDIDILVEASPQLNMESLVKLLEPILPATLAQGPTKFMGILRLGEEYVGHRVDIVLIDPKSYAYALMYFTGSQRFNILMRQRAIDIGLRLNEHGLVDKNGNYIPAHSEEDIFNILSVKYYDPVNRTRDMTSL